VLLPVLLPVPLSVLLPVPLLVLLLVLLLVPLLASGWSPGRRLRTAYRSYRYDRCVSCKQNGTFVQLYVGSIIRDGGNGSSNSSSDSNSGNGSNDSNSRSNGSET
jgi:hypothetical protein